MNVSMPTGRTHGWGIAGEYLATELGNLPPLEGVTLHCIRGVDLIPLLSDRWDRINIGYCFFENNIEVLRHTFRAAKEWDCIVAGSHWCEYSLRVGGIMNTATILQGIDPEVFYPSPERHVSDRFVVFSGGKFEYRKGQDLVIAAMKVLMQRHDDVMLSCAWHNHWPVSLATMTLSKCIRFNPGSEANCLDTFRRVLAENDIPLDRVVLYPLVNNQIMRDIYLSTDVGLFPNRCEGGNNMVMCEYMACGRTVVASAVTGHADVIHSDNSFPLSLYEPIVVNEGGRPSALWFEPSLDEIVESLEWAYQHRDELEAKSMTAVTDMKKLSWKKAAEDFYDIAGTFVRKSSSAPSSI